MIPEASALLAALPSQATPDVVRAFQVAYNAAGGAPALVVDGTWGSNTEKALLQYGTPNLPGYAPLEKTRPSAGALAVALNSAWPLVVGGTAPLVAIQLLLAQSAFETAQWASCRNWNFGNIKHVPGDGYSFFLALDDCHAANGEKVPCMFRAYASMEDGAKDYLTLLAKGQRYRSAWPYLLAGDPVNFVAALKAGGYFSGPLADYTAGVKGYFSRFQNALPSEAQLRQAAVTGGKTVAVGAGIYVAGGVAFLAGLAAWEWWKNR